MLVAPENIKINFNLEMINMLIKYLIYLTNDLTNLITFVPR